MNNVKIYGKENCSKCHQALTLCDMLNIAYTYVDIMDDEVMMDWFISKGVRELPQVFIDDDYLGGYDSFYKLVTKK